MDCRYLEDAYEIYLLGGLERAQQEELHEHVRQGCAYCRHELREAAENLYWLLQNVAPVRPSAAIKGRILQRLSSSTILGTGSRKTNRPPKKAQARRG